ncbi:hypothetical protein [Ornithinimicrobium kibberense]|uniref:hypothetical protein n=1 Tax=Ornithinimicrobium kibberense TaxID=282060 RepID=UPI00361A3380
MSWAVTAVSRSTAMAVPSPTRLPKEMLPCSCVGRLRVAISSTISASLASSTVLTCASIAPAWHAAPDRVGTAGQEASA